MPNRIAARDAGDNVAEGESPIVCTRVRCEHPMTRRRCGHLECVFAGDTTHCGACLVPPPRVRVAFALALMLALAPARALADDAGQLLAAAAVHEAGFDVTPDEIAAIHAVSVARCGGSIACQMPRFFAARTHRPWARWLRRDGTRPWGWPTEIAWSRARPVWLEVLRVADEVVAGRVSHVCEAPPQFWGMRHGVDMERARRAGLVEVRCGETRNAFWRQP